MTESKVTKKMNLVPNVWAVAVGRSTKLAQKQKNIDHTQAANMSLPPLEAKLEKKVIIWALIAEWLFTNLKLMYKHAIDKVTKPMQVL